MREKLTLSLLTRHFCVLLGGMVHVEFSDEDAYPTVGDIQQSTVDIAILPEHQFKSLDDVSEDLLMPAAESLAKVMKQNRAKTTFALPLPHVVEASRAQCDGISVRGMVMRGQEINGPDGGLLIFDAFRFDVLYRSETVQ